MKNTAPTKAETALLPPLQGLALDRIFVPATQAEFAAATADILAAGAVGFDTEARPTFAPGEVSDAFWALAVVSACAAAIGRRPVVAEQQAVEAGHSTDDELQLLCTHGVLHLLGYDHGNPEEHAEMFGLQASLLASWRDVR